MQCVEWEFKLEQLLQIVRYQSVSGDKMFLLPQPVFDLLSCGSKSKCGETLCKSALMEKICQEPKCSKIKVCLLLLGVWNMGDVLPASTFCIHPMYNSKQNKYDNGSSLSSACCVPGTVASLCFVPPQCLEKGAVINPFHRQRN